MLLIHDDLRRDIGRASNYSRMIVYQHLRNPEIDYFNQSTIIDQNIFRLDVSMNDSDLLQVNKSFSNLKNPIEQNLFLRYRSVSHVHRFAVNILSIDIKGHERIDSKTISAYQIGMVKASQRIYFID